MIKQTTIHPMAIVEEGATLGQGVCVEAYAVVKGTVTLEDDVVVMSHAYIGGNTTIGAGTVVYPGACIGTRTQDLKFRGEKTFVVIGRRCQIRECVTINSSCQENTIVQIGDDCLIMAYCHVAHNCHIGNRVIMTNNASLAGHVTIEDWAIIGGMTPIHQHVRIGCHAMVGGMSRVGYDVPPFFIGGDIPFRLGGINLVGLKRRGFPLETRRQLAEAFHLLYRCGLRVKDALVQIEMKLPPLPEIVHLVSFCRQTRRGIMPDASFAQPREVMATSAEE